MNKTKLLTLSLAGVLAGVTLASCNSSTVAKEAIKSLTIDSAYLQPKAGFFIPNVVKYQGKDYKVTWAEESENVEIVAWNEALNKVNIVRPNVGEENVSYELVATLEAEGKKATKSFEGVIMAYDKAPVAYSDVSDLYAAYDAKTVKVGDNIDFTGTVAQAWSAGYYLVDADGDAMYVYGGDPMATPGTTIKVSGALAQYKTLLQFSKPTVEPLGKTETVPSLKTYKNEAVSVKEIYDLNPTASGLVHGQKMKVTGVVSAEKSGSYVNYYLRDLEESSKKVQIYYSLASNELLEKIGKQHNQVVTYDLIYYTNYDSKGMAYVIYNGDEENLPAGSAIPADKVFGYDVGFYSPKTTIAGNLPTELTLNGNKYDAEYNGVDAEGNVLVSKDGKVTVKPETVTLKTFEVTIKTKDGAQSKKLTYTDTIKVGIDKLTSLKDVMEGKKKDTNYYIKATVVNKATNNDYVVFQDGKYYYYRSYKVLDAGKEVTISGSYDVYNGVEQIAVDELISSVDPETPFEVDYSTATLISYDGLKAVLDAGLTLDAAGTNEVTKAYLDKMGTLVKMEVTKGSQYLDTDGSIRVNADSDLTKTFAQGDKVMVYGIIGGFSTNKDGKISYLALYVTHAEKVVA